MTPPPTLPPALPTGLDWVSALRTPALAAAWPLAQWQAVVPQARRLRLLARLACALDGSGQLAAVPEGPRRHLIADLRVSRLRTGALRWAAERVEAELPASRGHPLVLLKGAAYLSQGLAVAQGRLPSDLDALVPRAAIAEVQAVLQRAGWAEVPLDAHDRHYYHGWSHEVPPMRHPLHLMELDLHHDILPPVARLRVDIEAMLAEVRPSPWPGWHVLQPVDQVLHSAVHLLQDSDVRDRLRDLVDLDGLLRDFAAGEPDFWGRLADRAGQLGLAEPLGLALHVCETWLGTPVDAVLRARCGVHTIAPHRRLWLLPLLRRLLTPADAEGSAPRGQRLASLAFLLRHHAGRMPPGMLWRHAWHKLQRSRREAPDAA